jgi:UDP-N-acetylmuramoyl-tripeptide--D-alanyl-D-alanine ligase
VIKGIEQYTPFENRFQPRKIKATQSTVISDCYNANPDSMKAAIQAFDTIKTNSKKIAVIGDMLELGTREIYWHRQVGRFLCNAPTIGKVILVGNLVRYVAGMLPENMILAKVQTWQEAEVVLKKYLADQEALVLVKASHSIALDKLVDSIC